MPIPAVIAAIATGIGGTVAWIQSLPPTAKYIIFLAGLMADATLIPMIGLSNGLIGETLTQIFNQGFNIPVVVSSWELVIIFLILPLIFYALKH